MGTDGSAANGRDNLQRRGAERRRVIWGWCKACRWLRRWHIDKGLWWVCPRGHYGGVARAK